MTAPTTRFYPMTHDDALVMNQKLEQINNSILANKGDISLYKRYGVSGIGLQANQLTRLYDSVGMNAAVGTDQSNVVNDFDIAEPFMRRKCVGTWSLKGDKAVFHVNAYLGDSNYTEDGSMGDYVAVECPLCYYQRDRDRLVISSYKYPGYRPFDIFCRNHNTEDVMPVVYLPAYALAMKDGKAVSLPGLENENGAYKTLVDYARTYDNGSLGGKAMLLPAAVNFYEYALFTVEFANQNCQSIMQGAVSLRSNGDDRVTFKDATHLLTSNYQAGRVVGYRVCIMPTSVSDVHDGRYKATHLITEVIRCDENGNESASGTHQLLTVQDLGKTYFEYDITGATSYKIGGRPYLTGAVNAVNAPSGSIISNTNGYYPMRYRYRENIYGNQYSNSMDLFDVREGTGDDDYHLKWYYLEDPELYTPSSTSKPDNNDLASSLFTALDVETLHEDYVSGYIRSKEFSNRYPDIWIPGKTTGASASTYFCDNAYLVASYVVRCVRFGGSWYTGSSAGLSLVSAANAPSHSSAYYGAHLFIKQG